MSNADKVLVQPLSTYFEGTERKDAQSEPYLASRPHAAELQSLGIAKIVEEKKGKPAAPPADEPDDEDEGEFDVDQPDDASDATAEQPAPRRRGRPPGKRS